MEYIEVLLSTPSLQYAFIGALLIGIIAPLFGTFALTKRLALIPDTLAHISLAGIACAWYLESIGIGTDKLAFSIIAPIIGAIFIVYLRKSYKDNQDIPIAISLSFALGLTAIFVVKSKQTNDLQSYLFRSVVLMNQFELLMLGLMTIATIVFVSLFYSKLLAYAFDEEYIRVLGLKKNMFDIIFFVALAFVVSFTIRVVGVMLVSGIMTLPVAIALKMSRSFKQVIVYAIIIAQSAIAIGMATSYYLNLPVSGTIILILVGFFIAMKFVQLIRR
ncbi:MAG: metal ABC transporter permease [Culicoidibacterales bacterium]